MDSEQRRRRPRRDVELPPFRRPTAGLSLITSALVVYASLTAGAILWGLVDGYRTLYLYPGRSPSIYLAISPAVGLGLGLVVVLLSRGMTRALDWAKRLHQEFHVVLKGLTTTEAFVMALASAMGEEAFFRGAMLPSLGLWWSSAIFGLAHLPLRRGMWPWPLLAFGMGAVFGWLYIYFGDLGAPIVAHFVINFLNLRFIAARAFPGYGPSAEAVIPEAPRPPDD